MTRFLLPLLAVLLLVDWLQTLRIARNPARWYERNPILGKHPSPKRVHLWFAACSIVATAVWVLLPDLAAWAFGLWIGAEVLCVLNNLRLGIEP